MELTIDDLARTVKMSVRNIREWQTLGLLPSPLRRGRVGVYTDEHLARIRRIKQLRAEGFPLELIRRTLDSAGRPAEHIDRVADQALAPFSAPATPASTTTRALVDRFGEGADAALRDAGLVTVDAAGVVTVADPAFLDLFERLVALGLPLPAAAGLVEELDGRLHGMAELAMGEFRRHVWAPFVAAGLPAEGWKTLADAMGEVRESAVELTLRLFRRALDDAAQTAVVDEMRDLGAVLGHDSASS